MNTIKLTRLPVITYNQNDVLHMVHEYGEEKTVEKLEEHFTDHSVRSKDLVREIMTSNIPTENKDATQ